MYEDKTFNNLMAEMLEELPNNIDKQEGSLIYNACAKMVVKLEEAYMNLSYVFDNLLPDEQDEDHLIVYGADRGVEIQRATQAVMKGEFTEEIETGTRFILNDLIYIVEEKISGYDYKMRCETAGSIGSAQFGELEPVDYISDFSGGSITEVIIAGKDQEDLEEYRKRVIDSFGTKEYAGNKKAYRNFIKAIDGVEDVKINRRLENDQYLRFTIIAAGNEIPSPELIDLVQTLVDPEENSGEGEGFANIDHRVIISGVTKEVINIQTTTVFDDGFSWETSRSQIEEAVDKYFSELAADWINENNLIVRTSKVIEAILSVDGVLDVTSIKLNGFASNITLDSEKIPKRGDLT